jgi:hypothetical protein
MNQISNDVEVRVAFGNTQKGFHDAASVLTAFSNLVVYQGVPADIVVVVEGGGKGESKFNNALREYMTYQGYDSASDTCRERMDGVQTEIFYHTDVFTPHRPTTYTKFPISQFQLNHGMLETMLKHSSSGLILPFVAPHVSSGPTFWPFSTARAEQWHSIVERCYLDKALVIGDFNPATPQEAKALEQMAAKSGLKAQPMGEYQPHYFEPFEVLRHGHPGVARVTAAIVGDISNRLSKHSRDYFIHNPKRWRTNKESMVLRDIYSDHLASRQTFYATAGH